MYDNWGGCRTGAGRVPLDENEKKRGYKIYMTDKVKKDIEDYVSGNSFSEKVMTLVLEELKNRRKKN